MLYKQDIRECFLDHKHYIGLYTALYPTYDVDQTYHQGSILDIALLLGQYHDNIITLWYS